MGKLNKEIITQKLIYILLIVAILMQTGFLLVQYRKDIPQIVKDSVQHGLWRSAKFAQGGKFANFMLFLNQEIPEDGRVVLPPMEYAKPPVLGTTPYIQFFLAPRQVLNCASLDCLDNLSRENTFILVVGDFPNLEQRVGKVLMFNQAWGILKPLSYEPVSGSYWVPFSSLLYILSAILLSVLWLVLITIAGAIMIHFLQPEINSIIKIALGYGLGLSLLTILLALLSLLGVSIGRSSVWAVSFTLLLIASLIILKLGYRVNRFCNTILSLWKKVDGWQIAYLILAGCSLFLSVGEGYHRTDEVLLWGAKGVGIAMDQSIENITAWGTNTLPYPLHIPLLIGASRILFSDQLPAGKIIFSGYFLALMFLIYHTLRHFTGKPFVSGLSTLLFASAPLVFLHSTIAYANLALTYYYLAATALWLFSIQRVKKKTSDVGAMISALMLIAANWTRPEASAISWSILILWLAIMLLQKRSQNRFRLILSVVTPLVFYMFFWYWINIRLYSDFSSDSGAISVAINQILGGDLRISNMLYILWSTIAQFFCFETWGLLGFAIFLLLFISLIRFNRKVDRLVPIFTGVLYMALIIVIYYFASFDIKHDISWWINTGFERMLLSAVSLLWFGSWLGIEESDSNI
jgi:hypothetical protein